MKKTAKDNQTNKSLITLCLILVFIIMALVGTIGYVIGRSHPRPAKSSYEIKETKEEEIKDIDNLKELSTTIDMLLSDQRSTEYIVNNIYDSYGFRYGVLKNDLTKENKQEIVLRTATWDKITGSAWKNNKTMSQMNDEIGGRDPKYDNWYIEESHQLSQEKVNAHSIDLFGEKIKTSQEQIGNCPIFIYDAEQKMYFRPLPQCGGTAAGAIHTYKSKFIQKKNEAYVYVSFAYLQPEPEHNYKVYKDFSYQSDDIAFAPLSLKDEYKTEGTYYSPDKNVITEDNYKDFSEYKFIFEKATGGNYYFVDIEQTK